MLYNYHAHTPRCNHAIGEEREYVENAIKGGLKILGFSDHAPYLFPADYQSTYRMKQEQMHEYVETVRALAKEYEKDIRILCGFELEYYPDYHKEEIAFLKQVEPDYLILGQHFLGDERDKYYVYNRQNVDDTFLLAYVTQTIAGLATGDFLYLAHPDIAGYHYSEECIQHQYERLCRAAKKMNIPLEWNLLGTRTNRTYPDRRFYEIAAKIGNSIILGTDAHKPQDVIDVESERFALQTIKELGLPLIETPLL